MKLNEIVFSRGKDETKEELFQRVGEQLKLLLEAGYLAVVRYDEPGLGIVAIDFEHDDTFESWGCVQPMWVTPEEAEEILDMRERE
jgi:hypothetical protein